MSDMDIRWKQRFSNYQKVLKHLKNAVEIHQKRELSDLEKQGFIQAFEFTFELAWKTMKDFLEYQGVGEQIFGSRDAIRLSFKSGLIENGDSWMRMIKSRNLTSHIYDEEEIDKIIDLIADEYYMKFIDLEERFIELLK